MTVVRAQSNHIAFIRANVDQLILPKEAANRRVTLADLFARLDRETNGRGVRELKTNDRMSDVRRTPVSHCEVERIDLRELHGTAFPSRRVVGFRSVFA